MSKKPGLTLFACVFVALLLGYPAMGAEDQFPTNKELGERNVALEMMAVQFDSGLKKGPDGKPNGDGLGLSVGGCAGSGFIVSEDGTILTNYHVARRAVRGKATFVDGSSYEIKSLKVYNKQMDLAVLKISADRKFPFVTLGDSDKVEPRDKVIAVGNPKDMGLNITEGIVSQVPKDDTGEVKSITHTSTITSGNSGGALYSGKEVIGVNVSVALASIGGQSGFNFAVPINKAKRLLSDPKAGRIIPLESVFPPKIDGIRKKAKQVKQFTGQCSGAKEGKPGVWQSRVELKDLHDYLIAVRAPGRTLLVTAVNSEGKLIGMGARNQPDVQELLIGIDRGGDYVVQVGNIDPQPAKFSLNIYDLIW
jgi:hypothetical protein